MRLLKAFLKTFRVAPLEWAVFVVWCCWGFYFVHIKNWSSAFLVVLWALTALCLFGCDVRRRKVEAALELSRANSSAWESIAAQWRNECFKARGLNPPSDIDGWVIKNNWKQ